MSDSPELKCSECDFTHRNKTAFDQHYDERHRRSFEPCPWKECNECFTYRIKLIDHLLTQHMPGPFAPTPAWLAEFLEMTGLGHVAQGMIDSMRPAIRLIAEPVSGGGIKRGASKLGGLPDLPPDVAWPTFEGREQEFLAQLRLEDLAPVDSEGVLPSTGMLTFFCAADDESFFLLEDVEASRVLYTCDAESLVQRKPPSGRDVYHECAVTPAREMTLGPVGALGSDQHLIFTLDVITNIWLRSQNGDRPMHQVLGQPYEIQDYDMAADARANSAENGPWRLLFQIDSDEDMPTCFGDMGFLYYWIRDADLRNKEFSQVRAYMIGH